MERDPVGVLDQQRQPDIEPEQPTPNRAEKGDDPQDHEGQATYTLWPNRSTLVSSHF
jgi:hypothetical protein